MHSSRKCYAGQPRIFGADTFRMAGDKPYLMAEMRRMDGERGAPGAGADDGNVAHKEGSKEAVLF
jgi:hypothetical protein